ncbi:hypothetical protein [Asanoa siamensis]|uniref:Uncharacterized protein n=1 Tax=Asanoa siamensis TaxID=926357 RepID=A0ABQ4CNZ9_9ACTN|nr:hypothetical protein [Asanoa siamensis]GIF72996.1 hypothetical protein Asi02nite_25140 [Asanoa siamensis]
MGSIELCPARSDPVDVRLLAGRGDLAATARTADPAERRRLTAGAWTLAWPVVYQKVTQPIERRRGHYVCAIALTRLSDECVDGFHDDVEAVVGDLLTHATEPIRDVEAWMASRVRAVTVDAHRRRRGSRGALQRPRVPVWLADALGHDAWLTALAKEILTWVGGTASAGTDLWPLETWAARRVAATGDWQASDKATVTRDVERVLAAMRRRPLWYEKYVRRPLLARPAPVAPTPVDDPEHPAVVAAGGEVDEAVLTALAAAGVEALADAFRRGADPAEAVTRIVTAVFGEGTAYEDLARVPGTATAYDEQVPALLADPAVVGRIVRAVHRIVRDLDGRL